MVAHIRSRWQLTQMRHGPHDIWPVGLLTAKYVGFTSANQESAIEEHHIDNFDPGAFFQLHDFDGDGQWHPSEILKTYGMDDPSAKDVPQDKKDNIISEVMRLVDTNGNGLIEKEEFMAFSKAGKQLPDFGLGPGHHWDMEMEYEIHHWEK